MLGHTPELIIVLVVALLIFGPKKLPEMGSAIGKSIKEFRKGMNELNKDKEEELKAPTTTTESYEAIERELASRRAATVSSEVVQETPRSEVVSDSPRV